MTYDQFIKAAYTNMSKGDCEDANNIISSCNLNDTSVTNADKLACWNRRNQ